MIRRPPRSTLFPTRRSSDLNLEAGVLEGGDDTDVGHAARAPARQHEAEGAADEPAGRTDRKSTRLNSSHSQISYAVFCLKKKKQHRRSMHRCASPDTRENTK